MKTAHTPDQELQLAVLDTLAREKEVDAADIGVQVRNGAVALSGVVSSGSARLIAEHAVQRVPGVHDIANDIEVRATHDRAADFDIARAVRDALQGAAVPEARLTSTVSAGYVTLTGTVDSAHERDEAARCVRAALGVRHVEVRIEVRPVEDARARDADVDVAHAEKHLDRLPTLRGSSGA